MNIRKYFGRPRFPWATVYLLGAVLLISLWPVVVLSLGTFRLGAVIDDWARFIVDLEERFE